MTNKTPSDHSGKVVPIKRESWGSEMQRLLAESTPEEWQKARAERDAQLDRLPVMTVFPVND